MLWMFCQARLTVVNVKIGFAVESGTGPRTLSGRARMALGCILSVPVGSPEEEDDVRGSALGSLWQHERQARR